jgi:hypothetical protein
MSLASPLLLPQSHAIISTSVPFTHTFPAWLNNICGNFVPDFSVARERAERSVLTETPVSPIGILSTKNGITARCCPCLKSETGRRGAPYCRASVAAARAQAVVLGLNKMAQAENPVEWLMEVANCARDTALHYLSVSVSLCARSVMSALSTRGATGRVGESR